MLKNFLTSNNEKITDKAFLQSLFISVISILLCLVALCSMSYAWFTEGTSSSSNTLMSGSFALDISVSQSDNDVATASAIVVSEVSGEKGIYTCTLPTSGKYLVTLTCGDSTAKGHCTVKINGCEKNTAVIIGASTANKGSYAINDPFAFTIQTTENDTVVEFRPVWGVAVPDIEKNQTYPTDAWKENSDASTEETASLGAR